MYLRCIGGGTAPTPQPIPLTGLNGTLTMASPNTPYTESAEFTIESSHATLEFDADYTINNTQSQMQVQIFANNSWQIVENLPMVTTSGTRQHTVSLSGYVGLTTKLRITFNPSPSYITNVTIIRNATLEYTP